MESTKYMPGPEYGRQNPQGLARLCDCGAKNPPQARKCAACGKDIAGVFPIRLERTPRETISYALRSADGAFTFEVDRALVVIGREATLREYLADKDFVSRRHARFTVVEGRIFVENLSDSNRTFVNNAEIPDKTPVALSEGDEIGLGGKLIDGRRQDRAAYFILRVTR